MNPTPTVLHGRHVRLEPLQIQHGPELWPAAAEPELWQYLLKDVRDQEDLHAWVQERLTDQQRNGSLPFLQRDAVTGIAFGSTSLFDIDIGHRRLEIGHTWIGRTHRRTRANTESKLLLLAHAFDSLHVNRVQLKCDARNVRSRTAILRIGAHFEGILRSHMVLHDGHRRDTALYSIIREEWPNVRARLQERLAAQPGGPSPPG